MSGEDSSPDLSVVSNSAITTNYKKGTSRPSIVKEVKSHESNWNVEEYLGAERSCEENLSASSPQNRIRRPANAFILFANDNRKIVKRLYPSYSNNQISSLLGEQWKKLDYKVKEEYYEKARTLSKIHKSLHPNYVYSPNEARKQKAKRELSQLMRKAKSKTCKPKRSVLQASQETVTDVFDALSYKNCVSSTTSKVQEPNPWQIIEFKLETENAHACISSEPGDVETCNAEIVDMEEDYSDISCYNETENLSDMTAELNLEESRSNKAVAGSDILKSDDDNNDAVITLTSTMEPVNLSYNIIGASHESGTSEDTMETSEDTVETNEDAAETSEDIAGTSAVTDEVVGPAHGDTPHSNHDIQYPSLSPRYPSTTMGTCCIPSFPCCVPTAIFDARMPFYPWSPASCYSPQHRSFMPNSTYPVNPFHINQANSGSSAILPSFASAFGYSYPFYPSFQTPHFNADVPNHVPTEASSYMSSYPIQPISQALVPRYNVNHSEYAAMETGPYMPLLPYRSSSQAIAPHRNVHFSDYVLAEGSMPPQALIPPNYYQSENIPPYGYSARIPTVMINENDSVRNADRLRNNLPSVTRSGN